MSVLAASSSPASVAASTDVHDSSSSLNQVFDIPAPPECTYDSYRAAEKALHTWTKPNGFNVSKHSAAYLPGRDKVIYAQHFECDRSRKPKNTGNLIECERVRTMRGSKRIGCPMRNKLSAVSKIEPQGEWALVHSKQGSSRHNHPPSQDVRIHAAHRQRAATTTTQPPVTSLQSFVRAQTAAGIQVANMYASVLSVDANTMVIPKDLSNAWYAARQEALATQTPIEALFSDMRDRGFYFHHSVNANTNEIRHLFWAHPGTTAFYQQYSDVLVLDCTYKTSRYNIPLLNIIAMTSLNTVLPVAQCWLPCQTEEDFVWALTTLRDFMHEHNVSLPEIMLSDRDLACLKAIASVFPSVPRMICRWHMNRNVLSKARQVLVQVLVDQVAPGQDKYENTWQTDSFMSTYFEAQNAETVLEFENARAVLKEKNATVAAYLDQHWWKYNTMIVRCWTKRYRHCGYQDTSAVEGTHAKCKRWLQTSRGDLYTVFQKLLPWWISSARALSLLSERNATITPHRFHSHRYSSVVRIITTWALNETEKLWIAPKEIVNKRLHRSACTGSFRVHGRPCIHELKTIIESNGALRLKPSDFDLHWRIRRSDEAVREPRLEEPTVI